MIRLTSLALIALMLGGCESMTATDIAFHGMNAVDAYQTIKIGGDCEIEEVAPITRQILGDKPKEGETIAYFIVVSGLYQYLRNTIPDNEWAMFGLDLLVTGKASTITNNQHELNDRGC